jgi:hypothetical protein
MFLCVRIAARSEDGSRLAAGSINNLFKMCGWYSGDVVQSGARDRGGLDISK